MLGKITIEIDFDTATPYILVKTASQSDDVRDKLINEFRRKLGHTSSWCTIKFDDSGVSGSPCFEIAPITPKEMETQMQAMKERVDVYNNYQTNPTM